MSRVCCSISIVCPSADVGIELKRTFGLLGMIGFSFSVVTSLVNHLVTSAFNKNLTNLE